MKGRIAFFIPFFVFSFALQAFGDDIESRLRSLEEALRAQQRTIEQQQEVINKLTEELHQTKREETVMIGKEAGEEESAPTGKPVVSSQKGGGRLRLIDISLDSLFAVGSSTVNDEALQNLQGGGHDPRKRGFTVQNVELSLSGAVDPYLNGEAHIIFFLDPLSGETVLELEEAFLTTTSLPYGLQLEAGHFFTEFGRLNPMHPHQWHWQDQPVINTRLFGPDGMRGPGFRLGWLTPLPWFSEIHFGVQNANGETMASFLANDEFFEERAIGGRPFVDRGVKTLKDLVYLARTDNAFDLTDNITAKIGFSGLFGPNSTGAEGKTYIYGGDLVVKWRPTQNERGWPFLILESEIIKRDYKAAAFFEDSDPLAIIDLEKETLRDLGFYTQLLYGFKPGWAAGIRYDYSTGSGESIDGLSNDPFRDNRHRISPLLSWMPSEFSRLRLQYNYDRADHLSDGKAHSVWLGVEFMYGAHAAHAF